MIPYGRQWIDEAGKKAVLEILGSDWITQGPAIERFESLLASYCGARYAVVLNSGTSALHAAYFAAGLSCGDLFVTTPNTFVATANAGLYLGARPVFADVESDTGNMDCTVVEACIAEGTKLLVPVHYAGHPVDLEPLSRIAARHNLCIIEDACHALGGRYKGELIGNCRYSGMTVFSFHPVKAITTGEGGAVLTNRIEYYEKLREFRSHGVTKKHFVNESHGDWYYEMQHLGFNYRMTDIQAALGETQLCRLERFIARRREIAARYGVSFYENPYFDLPPERGYALSAYHLYPIRLKPAYAKRKRQIFAALRTAGIGAQVHYIPVYTQPYYQALGFEKGICPSAEAFYQSEISIPMYPLMDDKDVQVTVDKIYEVFGCI